jgi:acetoin utilization protein AcuB
MKRVPTVADYMTPAPRSIGADQSIARARAIMREHRIRHLPVLRSGQLVGLVSDRDLAWIESMEAEKREAVLVDDAMTPFPYVVPLETPLEVVAATMAQGRFGSAIVIDRHRVVGVFTTTDAMRALADKFAGHAESRAAS